MLEDEFYFLGGEIFVGRGFELYSSGYFFRTGVDLPTLKLNSRFLRNILLDLDLIKAVIFLRLVLLVPPILPELNIRY